MQRITEFLRAEFHLGELTITPLSLLVGLLLVAALVFGARQLRRFLRDRVLPRAGLNRGVSAAIATLTGYTVLLLGLLVILPIMIPGFNLGTLSLIIGALSLGIGFGLRNIADNFISGLIILLERHIKVGDRIVVEGLEGEVVAIRARSTTVRTNDNIDIIVPNAEFVAHRVTNLSHNDELVRFRIPVGVHYRSDVHAVEAALLETAAQCPDVRKEPAPSVRFMGYGDSALKFELRCWSDSLYKRPNALRSQVNFKIWEIFKARGIEIPYAQHDLHLKSVPPGMMGAAPGPTQE